MMWWWWWWERAKNLEDDGLVVPAQVVSEHVGVHERLTTLTQDVDGFTQELHLNPRHAQLLHLSHLLTDRFVQLNTTHHYSPLLFISTHPMIWHDSTPTVGPSAAPSQSHPVPLQSGSFKKQTGISGCAVSSMFVGSWAKSHAANVQPQTFLVP